MMFVKILRFRKSIHAKSLGHLRVCGVTTLSEKHVVSREPLPFDKIPGPFRLPIIGSLYMYKLNGNCNISEYHKVLCQLHEKYGPIVREDRGSKSLIHVFDPEDVKTVFNAEGKHPVIPPLQETTQLYRQTRELSLGLGNTNGDEWYRLRGAVQKMMLRPKEVHYYLPLVDSVARDFVDTIEQTLDPERVSPDLRELVAKWSLESAGMVCFERRLGSFDKNEELAERMIEANKEIFLLAGILKLSMPFYKYFSTSKWKRFLKAEDFFYSKARGFIQETIDKIAELKLNGKLQDGQYNFISYLISRKDLDLKDVFILTLSLFGDGLSTTTPTFMFNLYCLAKHPDVQERIFQEIEKHLQEGKVIDVDVINNLQLLKAAVKETFRLYPNGTEISRILQQDLILGNYFVPAGTHVDLNQFVNFYSEKYFPKADEFIPDRWLRENINENSLSTHPYLVIPFGFGTRMCAGRRFAEQDIYTGLTRIVQKYRIELTNMEESMEQKYETLLFPKHPFKLRFIKR